MLHQNNQQLTTPRLLLREALEDLNQFGPELEQVPIKIAAADELLRRSDAAMHADPHQAWPAVEALHHRRPRRIERPNAA